VLADTTYLFLWFGKKDSFRLVVVSILFSRRSIRGASAGVLSLETRDVPFISGGLDPSRARAP